MERRMFSFLVLSGLCSFVSSLQHRYYHFINEPITWPEAQHYCREKYTDLATVNNQKDLEELASLIAPGVLYAFLGLYKSWGWSVTDTDDYKEGELPYWNWASGEPSTHYCGSIRPTGEWFATNCSSSLNFFCYDGFATNISKRFTLGNGSMNWLNAQAYCRNLHTDLARVRNQLENKALQQTVNNVSAWIGLTRMSWAWSDSSEPSFIPWRPLLSGLGDCTILVANNPLGMMDGSCDAKYPFFCYSDPVRKHLMRLELTAGDASVDMKDPAVMESVLTWVEKMLGDRGASEDVKLSWWKLPQKENNTEQEQAEILKAYEGKCLP